MMKCRPTSRWPLQHGSAASARRRLDPPDGYARMHGEMSETNQGGSGHSGLLPQPLTVFRNVAVQSVQDLKADTPSSIGPGQIRRFLAYSRVDGLRLAIRKARTRMGSSGQFSSYVQVEFTARERSTREGHLESGSWAGIAIGQLAEFNGRTDLATWMYELWQDDPESVLPKYPVRAASSQSPRVGLVGAGAFMSNVAVPALRKAGADIVAVSDASYARASMIADRLGIPTVVSAPVDLLSSSDACDGIVIACAHSAHPIFARMAIEAGIQVLLEKPAAVDEQNLLDLVKAASLSTAALRVGHNRRHASGYAWLSRSKASESAYLRMTVEAFPHSEYLWYRAPGEGGRVLGHLTHWIDLACGLFGDESPQGLRAFRLHGEGIGVDLEFPNERYVEIRLCQVGDRVIAGREEIYLATTDRSMRVEDWRSFRLETPRSITQQRRRRDRGHAALYCDWVSALRTGEKAPSLDRILRSHAVAFSVASALSEGATSWRAPINSRLASAIEQQIQ